MSQAELRNYLKEIEQAYRMGNATEHTYRSNLKELVETLAPGVTATNEPKRVKCGAPDFIITRKQTPLGYIETKDIGISLDHIERTDQMKRYLGSLGNLILTDYVEFRWYVANEQRMTARLAKVGSNGKWTPETDGIDQVSQLLQGFLITQTPTVNNPKELATRMASIAQLIRNAISLAFKSEDGAGSLHVQMEGFRQVLLPDLTYEQFADMYAQTICYGLFAARCNAKPNTTFTREYAAFNMPKTNPFLGKMFVYIAGPDLDERVVWAVDDLAEVLNRCDMSAILRDFGKRTRQEDPVVHFYETFLAAYDQKMREVRGVYYTPEPVVSYIVRSVDHLLKKDFDLAEGLADATTLKAVSSDGKFSLESHKVQILDPATGTGTFLHSIIDLIHETFKDNKGMWSSYVSQHLLPRLFGFELLMAPYTVAHMKLGLQLAETGYDFRGKERLGIYLTNSLEEGFEGPTLPFAQWLVEEADAAGNVKYDAPVMIILGNPPYSGNSANKGKWITDLLHGKDGNAGKKVGNYFEVDGEPLRERNPKYLNDDYVKFIRFAQWRIERTSYGILAFITNHGYLDNPTFRGMRQSLMQSFDEIYVLDLHGNTLRKEQCPDKSKDENVFDIKDAGVAISIFVRRQGIFNTSRQAVVKHAHLWGLREIYDSSTQEQRLIGGKYYWLAENDVSTTNWKTLEPKSPFYFLKPPQDENVEAEYERAWKVNTIFTSSANGFKTHRDHFAIAFNADELRARLVELLDTRISNEQLAEHFNLTNTRDWKLQQARRTLRTIKDWTQPLIPCLYRPMDIRFCYYGPYLMDWPRETELWHVRFPNICFATGRQGQAVGGDEWNLATVGREVADTNLFYRGGIQYFPLYLYPDPRKKGLFDMNEPSTAPSGRRPNLSSSFTTNVSRKLDMQFTQDGKGDLQNAFGPEDIFDYLYAIFHSRTYRRRYAEYLKTDFPRLPITSNPDLFRELCRLGNRLVRLHLMEISGPITTRYPETGNNLVEKVEYTQTVNNPKQSRVWINKTQYFEDVPPEAWEFHIGGYQVCHKWLKDRKGRLLSFDDIKHYQRIVAALQETIYSMEEIDETIEMGGGWPIE